MTLFWLAKRKTAHFLQYQKRRILLCAALAVLTTFVVIWAGYRFSLRSITHADWRPHPTIDRFVGTEGTFHDLAYSIAEAPIFPLMELVKGIKRARHKNSLGTRNYLLGDVRWKGWWYFFPLALSVKTPIPFLILAFVGYGILVGQWHQQKRWKSLALAVCPPILLLVCMVTNINIGLRHILPIYPFLAIVAAVGSMRLWYTGNNRSVFRTVVAALIIWQLTTSFLAHPDYLPYFNELAGRHPEKILIDSDLDWGQDLERLSRTLDILGVREVTLSYFGTADVYQHNMPPVVRKLVPYQPTTGWIAISLRKMLVNYHDGGVSWLQCLRPVALVGHSIRLYYVPTIKE
jgi:hypothetical protein